MIKKIASGVLLAAGVVAVSAGAAQADGLPVNVGGLSGGASALDGANLSSVTGDSVGVPSVANGLPGGNLLGGLPVG